jgi:threonine dehydrogenase-like Zn-dependent dehydrogenase
MSHGADRAGRTMRAGVLCGDGSVRLDEVPVPAPARGAVRLALEGCGMCGSDLPVWEGRPWFSYPRDPGAPGHETWGRIDALGPDVDGFAEGDRVAALSYHGYADFDVARADALVRLEPSLTGVPFPGEALGCAVNVFRRAGIQAGDTVAVVGTGFLGSAVVQLAARAGARVIAISRREASRAAARAMGAAEVVPFDDDSRERVEAITGNELCDVVVEAAGVQATLELAGALTRIRGRLVIAGYHQDGRREVDMQLWNWRGLDVINAHERDPRVYVEGVELAAAAVAAGELNPTPLYTHRFTLDRLGDAFEAVAGRELPVIKAVVCP